MGVVSVTPMWGQKTAEEMRHGEGSRKLARAAWTVVMSRATDGPLAVLKARGLPKFNAVHPDDRELRVARLRATPAGPTTWTATAEYEPAPLLRGDNPLSRPPRAFWSTAESVEAIDVDIKGRPLVNVVGETFDPPITRPFKDPVLTFIRNVRTFSRARIMRYSDTINADYFLGVGKGKARMTGVAGDFLIEGWIKYWEETFVIQFRADGWKRRILNQGYSYNAGTMDEPNIRPILDVDGRRVREPRLLDKMGQLVPQHVGVEWTQVPQVHWLKFDIFEYERFAALRIRLPDDPGGGFPLRWRRARVLG